MTVASATAKTGPYAGNGSQTVFPYTFKVFDQAELQVVLTSAGGIETIQTLTTHYTVSGVGQDAGGNVTMVAAPSAGSSLTIVRDVAFVQNTDLRNQGGFYPEVHERVFDRLTMQTQQLKRGVDSSLRLPVSAAVNISTVLPVPEANKIIGWNGNGSGLQNLDSATLATIVAYGTARANLFSGNGVQTQFSLSDNPGNQAVLDVSISGVTQRAGVDFTWSGGTALNFLTAPPAGTNNILARYFQGLPGIITEAEDVMFLPSGAGAVTRTAESKMRDIINVADYVPLGTVTATTDCQPFIRAAINEAVARGGGIIYIPPGEYRITTMELGGHFNLTDTSDIAFIGYGALLKSTFSSAPASTNAMFLLDGFRRHSFEGIRIEGLFARSLSVVSDYSIGGFVLQSSNRDADNLSLRNVEVKNAYFYKITRAVAVPTTYRARNILIKNGLYENGYYGINCQENGDNLTARNFLTKNLLRSYFVYGVSNHDVSYSSYGQDAFTDCVISAFKINTQNISVNAFIFGATTINAHLAIESLHDPVAQPVPATIKDVRVNINDINSTTPTSSGSVRFGYFQNATAQTTCATALFDNIILTGAVTGYIDFTVSQPANSGRLDISNLSYNLVGTAYLGSKGFYSQIAPGVRLNDASALQVRGGGNTSLFGTVVFSDFADVQLGYIDGGAGGSSWRYVQNVGKPFEITYGVGSPYATGTLVAQIVPFTAASFGVKFYEGGNNTAPNAANTVMRIGQANATGRSINATGTLNASGADYAEYERNNGLSIARGSIVGFKADGTLTLTYSEAVRFGVKSTNPSFVGGDDWACAESMSEEEYNAARAEVDRVAYSGKVPANVTGAAPGDYIIAAEGEGGVIAGQVVSSPTFKEYRRAVGRVNRILEDGRAEIAVIVH
jgi:hypothetical protein